MNTLSANIIVQNLLEKCDSYKNCVDLLASDDSIYPVRIEGIHGCLLSCFTAAFCRLHQLRTFQSFQYNNTLSTKNVSSFNSRASDTVIVVPDENEANNIFADLQTFFPEADIFILPWWGIVPYRPVAKGAAVFGKRVGVLSHLTVNDNISPLKKRTQIFIVTQRVFITPLPPPSYIKSLTFRLEKGQHIDTMKITEHIAKLGYTRVPRVTVRGEFSLRGEVLDIFLPGDDLATRIIFNFDCIENIRSFDTDSQSTTGVKGCVLIYPMKEIIWDNQLISRLTKVIDSYQITAIKKEEEFNFNVEAESESSHLPLTTESLQVFEKMINNLKISGECEGEEFFYPLLWDKKYSFLDYLNTNTTIIYSDYDRLLNAQETLNREYNGMYRRSRISLPVFPPAMIVLPFLKLVESFRRCIQINTIVKDNAKITDENGGISFKQNTKSIHIGSESAQSYFGNINYLKDEIEKHQKDGWHILIFSNGENQGLRIKEILKHYIEPDDKQSLPIFVFSDTISEGFSVPDANLIVIQENEIFGRRRYIPKSLHKAKSKAIDTFLELNPGDYIVHINYGIGIFRGIERVKTTGNERDYIKLEYAEEEFAFVPIEQVNLVQRYIGSEGEQPKIDHIGSKNWENRKNKVKKAVEDIAEKLIDLYSRRKAAHGYSFPKDSEWQVAFEAAFPYEDTPDQVTVTEEIKHDMEKPIPMDRLICGDVGYGKTEISMRAAFKAVMGGKQVALLAPTTILAEQHYDTFTERFRNFPVRISQLSRFVSPIEQKKTLMQITNGSVDILIGTHRILQKDVVFKNLGLIIIDEEQRFGVKDKEKLKIVKNNIDCLAMSATPIPRTLHMSLLNIRDMSLLTTPPQNRQPIETEIEPYDNDKVAVAIRREVERGGQVFYLHNRVETLFETKRKIEQIVPEMLVDVAHGQMSSEQLDDIFRRFKMGGFHVLIATTIIENGIDIPNVNTIIIDRADMYGVSQLYQLRGRVGRSDRQAYAYLFYPINTSLSEIAMKRLQVISDFTELGSGFKIAMKDMEIRGAGNLLGSDQSGDVYAVGFEMYLQLLNNAVEKLTNQKDFDDTQNEVLLELEYTGFIPDTYVQNTQTKMEIYKKIASIQTQNELDGVLNELKDRFGPVPDEVESLLSLAEIRILCKKLKIASIKEKNGFVQVAFRKVSDISINKILILIKNSAGSVHLDPAKPNILFMKLGKIGLKEKSEFIREKLEKIS
jgi:transcription-repair coupling factor (superfamily II helicase)